MDIKPRFNFDGPPVASDTPEPGDPMKSVRKSAEVGTRAIRKKNLRWLYDRFIEQRLRNDPTAPHRGVDKAFAISVGIDPKVLGHYWSGYRNIGNSTARAVEIAAHVPIGWMDNDQSAVSAPTAEAREFVQQALDLFHQAPHIARRMLLNGLHEALKQQSDTRSTPRADIGSEPRADIRSDKSGTAM